MAQFGVPETQASTPRSPLHFATGALDHRPPERTHLRDGSLIGSADNTCRLPGPKGILVPTLPHRCLPFVWAAARTVPPLPMLVHHDSHAACSENCNPVVAGSRIPCAMFCLPTCQKRQVNGKRQEAERRSPASSPLGVRNKPGQLSRSHAYMSSLLHIFARK